MKNTVIMVGLSFILLIGCRPNTKENTEMSSNNCDSSNSSVDTITRETSFFCFKEGLMKRVDINSNGDTVLILENLSDEVFSKTYLEQRDVVARNLLVRFGVRENLNLTLNYKEGKLNSSEGIFFSFKENNDSLFLKLNSYRNIEGKTDSIWVSGLIDYFPNIKEVFDVYYPLKMKGDDHWIYINEKLMQERKLVILGFSDYTNVEGTSGVMFSPYYLNSAIIEWNKKYVSQSTN